MKIIIVGKQAVSKSIRLTGWHRALFSVVLLGLPLALGVTIGYALNNPKENMLDRQALELLKARLQQYQQELISARDNSQRELQGLTLRLAELQARLVRLDAVGQQVTKVARLDKGEFDFSAPVPVGGPETELAVTTKTIAPHDFMAELDRLVAHADDRQSQLDVLSSLLANRKIEEDLYVAGRPIKKGWMSSAYGKRIDPFTGLPAHHDGVDFAGKEGADVIAVAAGVITWSGERFGYGEMIEVSHGNGYVSRYAHNKENLVKVGDIVKKGATIARMGSSGRSTGPHVHFEVYKHGRPVDPASYIYRAGR